MPCCISRLSVNRSSLRRGAALIYATAWVTTGAGFIALAVDFGRVQAAKSELNNAVEAAVRDGVIGLSSGSALSRAIGTAALNRVDGQNFVLNSADVQLGQFDPATRVFTAGASPQNAIRIDISGSRKRTISTVIGSFAGLNAMSIGSQAIAYDANISLVAGSGGGTTTALSTGGGRGFVGLDWFNINGPLTVRAWDSTTNTQPAPATNWAVAQTRGPANLNSGVNIVGELQTSGGVSMNGSTITRGVTSLPSGFGSFPMPSTPSTGVTNLGNYNGPAGTSQTFAAGKYYADTFQVPSGKQVVFTGPVELYVNGSFNIRGAVTTASNLPSNFKVFGVSGSGIDINSNASPLYAEVYAPNSPMNLNGRTFYGSVIAKGISVNSTFNMNIDVRGQQSGLTTTTTPTPPPPATPVVRIGRL